MHGILVFIIGPTGSGKGTLGAHAHALFPDLQEVITCTTRAMRPGEVQDVDYHFLTREEFEARVASGEFLETAEYGGNLYGSLKESVMIPLMAGKIVLIEIEVQGVRQALQKLPKDQVRTVFIDAGSWEELEKRVRARAPITEDEIAKRHKRFDDEMSFMSEADLVIKNGQGEKEAAMDTFAAYIQSLYNERN